MREHGEERVAWNIIALCRFVYSPRCVRECVEPHWQRRHPRERWLCRHRPTQTGNCPMNCEETRNRHESRWFWCSNSHSWFQKSRIISNHAFSTRSKTHLTSSMRLPAGYSFVHCNVCDFIAVSAIVLFHQIARVWIPQSSHAILAAGQRVSAIAWPNDSRIWKGISSQRGTAIFYSCNEKRTVEWNHQNRPFVCFQLGGLDEWQLWVCHFAKILNTSSIQEEMNLADGRGKSFFF